MNSVQSFAASDQGFVRPEHEESYPLYVPEDEAILQRKGILAVVAEGVGGVRKTVKRDDCRTRNG